MDIKRMHEMIEKLSEAAECEFSKGIENVDTCEMDKVVDMMKDLSEAMYYRTLTKAMQESDTEEIMEMFDRYGDSGKRYYDMWRYKSGRFAPKGRGTRQGYIEPPYYHMTPDMYREHDPEYYRDLDRSEGRLYFSEPITTNPSNTSTAGMRDHREGRSGMSRRAYMETKEMHKANTPEDKQQKMKSLEAYTKELAEDVTEMITDMSAEERALLKNKMQVLMQKI